MRVPQPERSLTSCPPLSPFPSLGVPEIPTWGLWQLCSLALPVPVLSRPWPCTPAPPPRPPLQHPRWGAAHSCLPTSRDRWCLLRALERRGVLTHTSAVIVFLLPCVPGGEVTARATQPWKPGTQPGPPALAPAPLRRWSPGHTASWGAVTLRAQAGRGGRGCGGREAGPAAVLETCLPPK